jgi:hypothetical protein
MLYPTGPGEGRELERGAIAGYAGVNWFPGSKRIVVCGNEAGRATRCFAQDLSGGAPKALTPEGVVGGGVSPDSQTLLGATSEQKFFLYPLSGGEPRPIPQIHPDDQPIGWSGNGAILLNRLGELPLHVEKLDLASGRRTPVREIAPADRSGVLGITAVTVSSDGKWYAYGYSRDVSQLFTVDGVK